MGDNSSSNFENYQAGLLGAEAFGRSPGSLLVNPTPDASFQDQARHIVLGYVNSVLDKSDEIKRISLEQIYVVWFSKTLKNWKALVSTVLPDGKYFEVTHNGEAGETYLDVYVKIDNVCVKDPV